ncbi:hypothetical protein [Denitrobaculum tricleocarpae]|uniref:DUF4412 domain-containing protein n=1 Tax=Denitrobaculum tricleocarpae TaxID=2591009 RepID=A0A545TWM4_9PROT|nr:hypothetical protein [Denitrobaculum tricleocarpae]TQV81604.1 hypothetical protein FKG95_04950 [Denitrobaculum tricleocarpae]
MLYRQVAQLSLFLAFISLVGLTGVVEAAGIPQRQASYSADAVFQINERQIASKVYHHEGKERREFRLAGVPQVLIMRPSENRVVYLLPLINVGMELTLGPGESLPDLRQFASLKPKKLGREKISGLSTTKYDVERLKAKNPYTVTLWLTDDGIPVQAEASDTRGDYRMLQSNIRRGVQDASLFEVPEGIKLAPVDAETLRGFFGG